MEAHIVLTMNIADYNTINSFHMWLLQSNWPDLINKIEGLCDLYTVAGIHAKVEQDEETAV